ncbi:MAG: DNA internalization-related competence protein ComEC/Rec2, partial [Nitrospira sp.]|nr:DNA internalization-related competence protein ComEC/Rec2 [Nitrospira sp.]
VNDISHYANGEKLTVMGMIDEPAKYSSGRVTAVITAYQIANEEIKLNISGRVKVTVYDPEVIMDYGDIIRITGRLKAIRGFRNPGLFDYAEYISREGIRTSLSISRKEYISKAGTGGNSLLRMIYKWRDKIRIAITKGLPEPSAGILKAMVIGDTGTLTNEVRDKFNAAGVTHILSISGSHLGFIALITFFIIRYILIHLPYQTLLKMSLYIIPSKIAAAFTSLTIIFYTLLSGGEVATVRSLIMAMVYLMAIIAERDDDTVNTFVLAALLVLLWNPQALFDISFQLSYTAVLSMIIAVKIFYKKGPEEESIAWWQRYGRKLFLFTLLTLSASLATAPVTAHYYNQISWTGLFSNLIIVPFVGFIVLPPGLFTSLLIVILNTDVIPLAWLNNILLNLFYSAVKFFAQFPFAIIYTPSPGLAFIFALYLLMLSVIYFKNRLTRPFLPAAILLVVISIGCNRYKEYNRDSLRVSFLDVGQGDSALIEFPDRKIMLIDGGGTFSETFDIGRSVVAPYLWNSGIRKVDYVVSSHPQLDHIEGLVYVIDKFSVGEVWDSGVNTTVSREFKRIVDNRNIREIIIDKNTPDKVIGGCNINFLNPPAEKEGIKINNISIVMRILCPDISILFTGDIEATAMEDIAANNGALESLVIKVPHHGSKGSVENNFITSVKPHIAVISVGYQNPYHHPSVEAVSAYENTGAVVYRTDMGGAVIIKAENGILTAGTYEDMVLKEIRFNNPESMLTTELSNFRKIGEE